MKPLELELRKIAAETHIRCGQKFEKVPLNISYTNVPSHKGHRQLCEEFLRNFNLDALLDSPNDQTTVTYFFDKKYKVDYQSMQLKDNPNYGYPQHTNCKLSIFSDGSLIKKPAESAASGLSLIHI